MSIKAIIFDIGGVVVFTDFSALYTNFAKRVGISPEFVAQYHKDNWSDALLGNISLERFFEDMRKAGAKQDLGLQVIWLEEMLKLRTTNEELLDFIEELRKNYTVGVLSNLTPTRMIADEHTGIYGHFDFVILSCIEHLKKPDPEFYRLALEKAGVSAAEAIFVDDLERNTLIAREMGFIDILYKDNKSFLQELKKYL